MRNVRDNKGFTLIELMIVVVIIGILAAIAIPKFTTVSQGAKEAEAEPIMKQICTLASAFQMREGRNPTGIAELTTSGGWADPQAKYFQNWAYTPGTAPAVGTVTAALATGVSGVRTPTMNCDTKVVTWAS